jgi:pimeloyl-ACP methyl ester carboxylesterase
VNRPFSTVVRTRQRWIPALCSSIALALSGCATLPGTQSAAVGDGHTEYVVRGHGQPTVVFESGLGDGMDVWAKVLPDVSTFATTFAYNRPGYGGSTRASTARDGMHIVEELRTLLKQLGLPPPYVLVGHSVGGTYQELFARLHPTEVAGVVLVESRAESMTRRCREAKLLGCDPPKWLVAAMAGAASAEYAASDATFEELRTAPAIPPVPLIVLTSTKPRLVEGPAWAKLWQVTQEELSKSSPQGEQRRTWISGHYIQKEQPPLVIDAVRDVTKRLAPARHSGIEAATRANRQLALVTK